MGGGEGELEGWGREGRVGGREGGVEGEGGVGGVECWGSGRGRVLGEERED